jgi:osmotically-inducible protein OsmY
MTARVIACLLMAAPMLGGCLSDATMFQTLDDASSATEIKTRLLGAGLNGRFMEVDVAVVDKFVLLSGRVATNEDRAEAERIAWEVGAIDEVANEIVIDHFDLGRDLNDTWITGQIHTRLIGDGGIKGTNFNVQVYNGVVFLLGVARTEDELRRAAEHASMVGGVQRVISYVKIRERAGPPPEISVAASPEPAGDAQNAPISLAPRPTAPAPIVPPDNSPSTRPPYSDPYATGAKPPPGSDDIGLQSRPLPPVGGN